MHLVDVVAVLCCCAGGRLHTVLFQFLCILSVLFIRFWGILMSFWYPWGLVWLPWALPRDTRRGKLTAVTKKLVFDSIMVSPKGSFGHPPSAFFVFFTMTFRTIFSKCFSEHFQSLQGPPHPSKQWFRLGETIVWMGGGGPRRL